MAPDVAYGMKIARTIVKKDAAKKSRMSKCEDDKFKLKICKQRNKRLYYKDTEVYGIQNTDVYGI